MGCDPNPSVRCSVEERCSNARRRISTGNGLQAGAETPPMAFQSWAAAKWVRKVSEVLEKGGMALQPAARSGKGAREESLMRNLPVQYNCVCPATYHEHKVLLA